MRLIGLGILIGCTTALIVASEINYYSQSETISTTITGTEVKRASKDTDKYLIYTPGEVFENTDSLWLGKFDSSDVQNLAIQAANRQQTCTLNVVGFRYQVFSIYRNIVSVSDCHEQTTSK